jgi:uncharacterized membrane protein
LTLFLDIAAFLVAAVMSYYAFRSMDQMKQGRFEPSWRYMSIGAIIIAFAMIALMVRFFGSSSTEIVQISTYGVNFVALLGGSFILLGFRLHYKAWNQSTKSS